MERATPFLMLVLALLAAWPMDLEASTQEAPVASGTDAELAEFGEREAAAEGLEDFVGGFHGVILIIAVLFAAVLLVGIIIPW